MKVWDDSAYARRFYPFAEPDTPEMLLAAQGYIQVFDNPVLVSFFGEVRFNLLLEVVTPEKWAKLKETADEAFNYAARVRASATSKSEEGQPES